MNGAEEKKKIRRMNIRYALISGLLYLGIYIVLIVINLVMKTLLDFGPYIQLVLYLAYFIIDAFLTRAALHLPSLRKIIYDPGY